MRTIFASCLAGVTLASLSDHWTVIVGGGKGYTESYMYQSDAAQAYRISQFQHVQDANQIYMAYNDIAFDPTNPFPG